MPVFKPKSSNRKLPSVDVPGAMNRLATSARKLFRGDDQINRGLPDVRLERVPDLGALMIAVIAGPSQSTISYTPTIYPFKVEAVCFDYTNNAAFTDRPIVRFGAPSFGLGTSTLAAVGSEVGAGVTAQVSAYIQGPNWIGCNPGGGAANFCFIGLPDIIWEPGTIIAAQGTIPSVVANCAFYLRFYPHRV